MRVILVSMPFGALERQALGLSLLKACLTREGVACDVRYLNLDFAGLVGIDEYMWISRELPHTAFAGDFCFTEQLYGAAAPPAQAYIERILTGSWQLPAAAVQRVLRVRSIAGAFIEHCLTAIDWSRYDVVGFTSTFEQNIASLALARRLKGRNPRLRSVFGGANWEGEMGRELHRQFPFVDYVCSGEAERSFPALVRAVARGELPKDIPGVVYREGVDSVVTSGRDTIQSLDELPIPDHSDYFRDLAASSASADIVPVLLFETARGCWWGAKSHCTFCGLNGGSIAFRAKSQERALDELIALSKQWCVGLIESVDNILDMRYFQHFLPELVARNLDFQLFFEVKANLTRMQVKLLAEAGARRIQPGIESMNDHVLQRMRKGTRALQNIQLLKWCREYGVCAEWNLLYGFPGETAEDYRAMLALLPAIRFLGPPSACGPLRLDRFSPYFERPSEFGIKNLRAIESYAHIYPFEGETLSRLAYYFDFEYESDCDPTGYADPVIRYVQGWRTQVERGALRASRLGDGRLWLDDTRTDATMSSVVLGGLEQAAYEYCDQMRRFESICSHVRGLFPGQAFDDTAMRGFLDSAVANGLMVCDDQHYLGLALASGPLRAALESSAMHSRGRRRLALQELSAQ